MNHISKLFNQQSAKIGANDYFFTAYLPVKDYTKRQIRKSQKETKKNLLALADENPDIIAQGWNEVTEASREKKN